MRRGWLFGLVAAGLLALGACGKGGDPPAVRRVILVSCDTLRADRLGAYGCERPTSPHVDELARDAVLYESAWSCAPLTAPAMSSLLAGKIPEEIGMAGGNHVAMPPQIVTLPEVLSAAGIETAAVVSIAVLRRPPASLGDAGVSQGFRSFDDEMTEREGNREFLQRSGEKTTDAAIAWLARDPDRARKPFFLWVHYQDPHGPYTPREPWASELARAAGATDAGEPEPPIGTTNEGKGQIPASQVIDGQRRPGFYRDRYDGEVRTFDEAFGRLVRWLKEHDLYEGSLLVFTADHGESLGEHDYWFCHAENLYREELAVPLIVRWPGGPRGERRDSIASHLDVWPTVLEALGLPPRPSRGTSLLASGPPAERLLPHSLGREGDRGRWSAATGPRYRIVLEDGAAPRLYDRLADPAETADLAAVQQDRARDLETACRALFAGAQSPGADPVGLRNEETLRALGYTEGAKEK
jgi:arylsulfatase